MTGFPMADWPAPYAGFSGHHVPYVLFCLVVAVVAWAIMSPLGDRVPRGLTVTGAVVVFIVFFHYDFHYLALLRGGADNTEALELGASALLHLHDPYTLSTHTGSSIGPLLGGLLLAVPLYALAGSLTAQIPLYWAGAAALAEYAVPRAALAASLLVAASPWSRWTLPYENDNGVTALGVVVCSAWGWWLVRHPHPQWARWIWVLVFACALDYRWTMWAIGVPYGVLFVRALGFGQAMRWLLPVLGLTLTLFLIPFLLPSGAFAHRSFADQMHHQHGPLGTAGTVLVMAAAAVVLTIGCLVVRSLAGVWGTTAATLITVLGGFALVAAQGYHQLAPAFHHFFYFWYTGWVLVFGVAALVCPRAGEGLRRSGGMADGATGWFRRVACGLGR